MAFTTIPAAGAKLRGATLSALVTELRPISVIKTADTTRTSTISRTADPDLTLSLPINTTWKFELVGIISSAAAAAGDFSGELQWPASAILSIASVGPAITITTGTTAPDVQGFGWSRDSTSPTNAFEFGCIGETSFFINGTIEMGGTAGSLLLAWAQQASNATGTTLQDGSRISAWRLS